MDAPRTVIYFSKMPKARARDPQKLIDSADGESTIGKGIYYESSTATATTTTTSAVSVLVNGTSVAASYAGLAPGPVGLFQVNAQIPESVAAGNAVMPAVSVGGAVSNSVTIAIQ